MFLKVVFIKDQVNTFEKMFKVPYDEHQQFMISRHLTRFKNIYINYRLWNWISNLLTVWWFVNTREFLFTVFVMGLGCLFTNDTGQLPVQHLIDYGLKVSHPSSFLPKHITFRNTLCCKEVKSFSGPRRYIGPVLFPGFRGAKRIRVINSPLVGHRSIAGWSQE